MSDDDEPDLENPYVQSLMFTELFHTVEDCDSKRVEDFWGIIDETTLWLLNRNNGKTKRINTR